MQLLDPTSHSAAKIPDRSPPLLMVVVDTEEEFDWGRPHARENTSVTSIAAQGRGQEVMARHGIVPTYVVDFPVVADDRAVGVLGGIAAAGGCHIGTHLHPWVNPPFEEAVNAVNSYPGNLPPELERAKLTHLTEAISEQFGQRPVVYRAGRYGVGPATATALEDLGYLVDTSVVPYSKFTDDGGPDFERTGFRPYWFGEDRRLLEVPLSCGFHGLLKHHGKSLYPALSGPLGMKARLPGFASRLGLLERIRLTPEGIELNALIRLTESLLSQGCKLFCFSYHSPSLEPGNTPYVRDAEELRAFLSTMDRYFGYFIGERGGKPTTAADLYRLMIGSAEHHEQV